MKIPQKVGIHYKKFGTFLLKDETGIQVDNIASAHSNKPEDTVTGILQEWIGGRGRTPQTWCTLITVLKESELYVLAKEIEEALQSLSPHVLPKTPSAGTKYYSTCVQCMLM